MLLTGYVLREELFPLSYSFLSTWGKRIPESFDENVVIRPRYDGDISSGRMANFGAIAQHFDIHIRYDRGIFRRIRDIDSSLHGER